MCITGSWYFDQGIFTIKTILTIIIVIIVVIIIIINIFVWSLP